MCSNTDCSKIIKNQGRGFFFQASSHWKYGNLQVKIETDQSQFMY